MKNFFSLSFLFLVFGSFFLSAQNTWTGNANNDWHNACNWSRHRIPTCADSVLIPSGIPTINAIAGCYYITVSPGAEVDLNSTAGGVLQVGTCPVALTYSASCVTSNTWCQKVDFGGSARNFAIGFSIGTKGYIGLGDDFARTTYYTDFWEWDQTTNAWTQKANYIGAGREQAMGFSIGTKGYIGAGVNGGGDLVDFYQWDQATNTWSAKANLPVVSRRSPVAFSIGTKGYIGTGWDTGPFGPVTGMLEYDQTNNRWTAKTPFPGIARVFAGGFAIGAKGYIGLGSDVPQTTTYNDFYEFDPANVANGFDVWGNPMGVWTAKTAFPGAGLRDFCVGFSIGTKGYLGTGTPSGTEFWEYNQGTNAWTQKTSFSGGFRYYSTGFSIGTNGYIGTGAGGGIANKDFWEYCQ